VRAGLVGDDVGREVHLQQLRNQICGVADQAHRERAAFVAGTDAASDGIFQRVGDLVEVTVLVAPLHSPCLHVDAERNALVHRDRQRLGAAHTAETSREGDGATQRAIALSLRLPPTSDLCEALVGALQDALSTDVDP
jgi:hypothetical protein